MSAINSAQLRELHRWQKWVLADRVAQHGVTVLSQESDGGIILGKGSITARIPGTATVEEVMQCAEAGLLDVPVASGPGDDVPLWLKLLLLLAGLAVFGGMLWLGGIFIAAEGAYHYGEGMR